jgi:FkbM family methyltransferase
MSLRDLAKALAGRLGLELMRRRTVRAPYQTEVHAPGRNFQFWIANDTGARWYTVADQSSNAELVALRSLARPGDRVLEVGCHHGFHTVYLGTLVGPGGTVVAVEAEPGNALIAQAQLQLNGLDRCRVVSSAAGAQAGRVRISLVDNVISGAGIADELIEVPVVTGDELDRQHGPFTVLKVDVEGYEAKVLRGCAAIIKRRPRLALELHGALLQQAGDRVEDIQAILVDVGYHGTVMVPKLELIPYEPAKLPMLCREHAKVNLFLTPD